MAVRALFAEIPPLSPEVLAKLWSWSKEKFERSDVHMNLDESHVLLALCTEEGQNKTVRDWQRLLRTNLQNWGAELPKAQKGWLRGITVQEYESVSRAQSPQNSDQSAALREPDALAAAPEQNTCASCRGVASSIGEEITPATTAVPHTTANFMRLHPPVNLLRKIAAH